MSLRNDDYSYGNVAKTFHWVIAVILIFMLVLGYCIDDFSPAYKGLAIYTHKITGLCVLLLMLLRIVWALINPKPVLPPGSKIWERFAERFVHWSLYAALIAMPLLGWMGSVAAGKPPYIKSWQFNLPIALNKPLSHRLFHWHGNIAILLIALLSIHVIAALFHHFIRRDSVLQRMLPTFR